MLQFPPLPTWDSFHPLIIHFPIALLLLSPLFVLISAVPRPPKGKPYLIAALVILVLGTVGLFIAGSTGHAASELAERGGAVDADPRGVAARRDRSSGSGCAEQADAQRLCEKSAGDEDETGKSEFPTSHGAWV